MQAETIERRRIRAPLGNREDLRDHERVVLVNSLPLVDPREVARLVPHLEGR
jgi:hypothetical protein